MDLKVAFIFDMDGVIVDSNPAHKSALKQFCRKYGKNLSEDELREKIYGRRTQDWLVKIFGPLDEEKMRSYADEKEALFRKVYDKDIRAVDGLEDFLKRLEAQKLSRLLPHRHRGAMLILHSKRPDLDISLIPSWMIPL